MAETFYRKYRPMDFSGLSGQKHIKKLLENAVEKNAVSHAYIFSGPRGTGKTTVARILAKRLNCENPNGFEPCNECSQCRSITSGNHMDVIEMDAASNRGIDDFRSIRDKVSYKPAEGKYKVYIIDEVHMLTTEAFNAILKTLEEPPEHVVFILATTNPEKIPETIISRCQLLPFKNLSPEDIEEFMETVCENEHISISEDALRLISDFSKGGMRDALVLLEQVSRIKSTGETVEYDDVLQITGGVKQTVLKEFLEYLINANSISLINLVEELYFQGVNFEVFLESLSDYIIKNLSDYDFRMIIGIAQKISELSKSIKFAGNKKAIFIITFLAYMKESVSVKEKTEAITSESGVLVKKRDESKAADLNDAAGLPSNLFEVVKKKDISLYVSLMLSDVESGEGKLLIGANRDNRMAYEVLREREGILREFLSENGYEAEFKQELSSGGENETEKKQQKPVDEKFHSLSEEMKDAYRKLEVLFPGKKIVIKENLS